MDKSVTILSFSGRKNGNCTAIAQYISNCSQTNVRTFVIDENSVSPCGGCDYECLRADVVCPKAAGGYREMMDAICGSSMVYFIVPNFCGYPCANYFAFNERTVGYFNLDRAKMTLYMSIPKRFIVVSNTEGFESAMAQQTNEPPKILYLKSGKYRKRSIAGDLLEAPEARADLDAFLNESIPNSV